jgi:hypothetical protein
MRQGLAAALALLVASAALSDPSLATTKSWCLLKGRMGPGKVEADPGGGITVEGKAIDMLLLRSADGKLSGDYFYGHVGKPITIDGHVGEDGAFVMEESAGGKKTGVFRGRFEKDCERMVGDWQVLPAKKGAKKLDFELLHDATAETWGAGDLLIAKRGPVTTNGRELPILEAYRTFGKDTGLTAKLGELTRSLCDTKEPLQSEEGNATCGSLDVRTALPGGEILSLRFFRVSSTNWDLGINQLREYVVKLVSLDPSATGNELSIEPWLVPGALERITAMAKGPLKAAYLKAVAGREEEPEPEAFERSFAEFKVDANALWPMDGGLAINAFLNPDGTVNTVGFGNLSEELDVELKYDDVKSLFKPDSPLATAIRNP